MIGIKRAAIINGGKEIYVDQDDIRIQDNTLYTEKQAYDIEKIEQLPYNSYRYFIKEKATFNGGDVYQPQELDLGKMQGINKFLTGNQEEDKQILKFAKRSYRQKYGLENLDNVQLKYNFNDVDQQIQQTEKELKMMYKFYSKQKIPEFSNELNKSSKRIFGVDYGTFLKYKSQITGAQLQVEEVSDQYEQDEQRMSRQLFGGCECELNDMFQFNKYQVLKYDGGKRYKKLENEDSLLQYLYDSVKQEYKYEPSGYLISAINSNEDKLHKLKQLKGASVNNIKKEDTEPEPQIQQEQPPQPTQEPPQPQQEQLPQQQEPPQQQEQQPPQWPQGELLINKKEEFKGGEEIENEQVENDLYSSNTQSETSSSESDEMNYKIGF